LTQQEKKLKIDELELQIKELKLIQSKTRGIYDLLSYQREIDDIKKEIEELK